MTAPFITLFGLADDLTATANVIREIANDLGHNTPPQANLLSEIHDLELVLDSLKNYATARSAA
jgi:hypothetical protein